MQTGEVKEALVGIQEDYMRYLDSHFGVCMDMRDCMIAHSCCKLLSYYHVVLIVAYGSSYSNLCVITFLLHETNGISFRPSIID